MLDQKTVQIGETDYTIEQLPTIKGLEVTFAIGHILKGLAEGVSEEFVLSFKESKINIGKMVSGVIACTDVKGTPDFIRNVVITSVVKPDMDSEIFDTHFAGNYEELADLLTEIFVFNKFDLLVKKKITQLIDTLQASE